MPFHPPPHLPKLPIDPPDTVSIPDFLFDDKYQRHPLHHAQDMFVCGLSGKSYKATETVRRVEALARGLQAEWGWEANKGSEWDKIAGVFSVNTVDTMTLCWAVQKLGGIVSPANAAYTQPELEHQFRDSGAKVIFTCLPLLAMTLKAAQTLGIPKERIYLLEVPSELVGGKTAPPGFQTIDDLIKIGENAKAVEPLKWSKGEGARRVAYLCYSSGTSGLPKGVMISHRNVIANTLSLATFDMSAMKKKQSPNSQYPPQEVCLGMLPMSHIYSLVVMCHAKIYTGDSVIVLPKFDMASYLGSIQRFKINTLYIVPPIVVVMNNNRQVCQKFDLSSVTTVFSGAAPLGKETADQMQRDYPSWQIRQGYGLTETCTVVSSTDPDDIWFGSSGCLIPGFEAKLMDPNGKEVTELNKPGELLVKGPSIVLGYLKNDKATKETFVDGWMRTGDECEFRKSPNGMEHLFIVDRIKELIKVKGHQVAPAELESFLLNHPAVADCCVLAVPDESAGEVPKAFVVKSAQSGGIEDNENLLKREIQKYVEQNKSRHKWLKGGVEFIDVIPKSPSGKILRRLLRDQDREKRRKAGAKM